MTKFLVIEPATETIREIERNTFEQALLDAGLRWGEVDHGMLTRSLGIVAYEFGLFDPSPDQHYTIIDGRLFAGNLLLYGVGERGETVDAEPAWNVREFLHSRDEVERAIQIGAIARPQMTVNDEVIWQWPAPAPFDTNRGGRDG